VGHPRIHVAAVRAALAEWYRPVKLIPELVPAPLWGVSAYRLLPSSAWRKIRGQVLQDLEGTCSVCSHSQERGMICHEVWEYDEAAGVATLGVLTIVCHACNLAEHPGRAGAVDVDRAAEALDHLATVDEISLMEARLLLDEAGATWARRSRRAWQVSVAPELVQRFPALAILIGVTKEPG